MTCNCVCLILVAFTLLRKSHRRHLYGKECDKIQQNPFPKEHDDEKTFLYSGHYQCWRRRRLRGSSIRCGKSLWVQKAKGQGHDRRSTLSGAAGTNGRRTSYLDHSQGNSRADRENLRRKNQGKRGVGYATACARNSKRPVKGIQKRKTGKNIFRITVPHPSKGICAVDPGSQKGRDSRAQNCEDH